MFKYYFVIMLFCFAIFCRVDLFAVTPQELVTLKNAGVSDSLLKKIVATSAITRALISVDEIIKMRKTGIGDEVILAIIEQGNATASELDLEDKADRALNREIRRQELELELAKKDLAVMAGYISKLVNNPEIINLVRKGKISSEDYADIIKYLKQYAGDEDTDEYGDDGDVTIDINKINK